LKGGAGTAICNFDAIPEEVKASRSWTMWKRETRDDQPAKVPYQPNGKKAKSNDPSTWYSFSTVFTAFQDLGGFDGICWMMPTSPGDLVFIDVDHCIIDGTIEPWALEVVERFNSYTEVSQSGNGLHILIKGKKPIKRCRKAGSPFEIYDCLRPCYLTGNVVEGLATIEPRPEDLDRLYQTVFAKELEQACQDPAPKPSPAYSSLSDEALILKATISKGGNEFKALFDGSTLGYGGDDSAADMALMNKLAFWTGGDALQMERLFSSSGLGKREKWRNRPDYRERTIQKAIADAREFYEPPKDGFGRQQHKEEQSKNIHEDLLKGIDCEELTEGGNAARLERIHGDDLRYNHTHKKWYLWDNGRWAVDGNGGAMRLAADVVGSLYFAASKADGKDVRNELVSFAKETDTRKGLNNMLALAANRLKFALTADDFDKDAWLLCAENVTIDLKTGSPREPRQEDLITKTIGARYDRAAKCPLWLKFLDRTFPDEELRRYIKRAVGYCLTGSMGEQVFFFCYGQGANGKTVFLAVLEKLLGEYANHADFSTFLVQRNEKVRNDLAALAGARVITAIEAEEGGRLSMQVIKSWTGGDPVTARFLFAENFTFRPQGKLWLAANNKPAIPERNYAAWRRVRLIPFTSTIPEAERVKEYEKVLYSELSGILNWALEGLKEYLESGLAAPKAVLDATNEYRRENDSLEQFVFECCEIGKLKTCKNTELYGAYLSFCGMSGLNSLSQHKFSPELDTREGISSTKTKHGVEWKGIALKNEWVTDFSKPSPQAGGAKGDGLGQNAQSNGNSSLRENFAHLTPKPSPHNDSETSPIPKSPLSVSGRDGEEDGQKVQKQDKNINSYDSVRGAAQPGGSSEKGATSVKFNTDYQTDWKDPDGKPCMHQFREGEIVEVSLERAQAWAKRGVVAILEAPA
jgi:putative DNA primase/helicase